MSWITQLEMREWKFLKYECKQLSHSVCEMDLGRQVLQCEAENGDEERNSGRK